MTPWHARIDRVIRWLKWPTAIFSTAALPTVFWAIYGLGRDIGSEPWRIVSFLIGIAIFMVAWRSWLATTRIGNWLIQFEHELTHMIFAILTFHPVIGFRASVARGSHIRFVGEGNWLITAAPYFFPTAAVFLWFFSWFLPIQFLPWSSLALGIAMGYHIVSTIRETHVEQNDLKEIGFGFSWLFLPFANLWILGLLVAFAHRGVAGVSLFLGRMVEPLRWIYGWF